MKVALFAAIPLICLAGCIDNRGTIYNPWGTNELGIPHDAMPPAGLCRVWYPNRPARNQPPPGDCDYLAARLPSGAQLIRGGSTGTSGISSTSGSVSAYPNSPTSSGAGSLPPAAGGPSGVSGQTIDPNDIRSRRADDLNRRY